MNDSKMLIHGIITFFILAVFVAGVEHILPYDAPAMRTDIHQDIQRPAPAQQTAPADDCLATANGNPCIPTDKIFEMMDAQPETVPNNSAVNDEETI